MSSKEFIIQEFKHNIAATFKIKDLGEIHHLLSIRISRREDSCVTLDQSVYASELLETTNMQDAKGASTPLDPGALKYRQDVGGLLYLAGGTRPDLAFATTYMSQFNNCPSKEHWAGVQHILRYLKQTKELKLTFQKTGKDLEVFCDSDWAGDKIDRRSFSGYVVLTSRWSCLME
ncbi:secreted RxLR effector protein 161-like, partial [Stegodyphus dumicola]|uniref:secreted RxLR effector protein 161-like n=1 Tax=Stegodyphus dumicola TaxID=202533 RepID=UPI0015A95CDF